MKKMQKTSNFNQIACITEDDVIMVGLRLSFNQNRKKKMIQTISYSATFEDFETLILNR